MVPKRLEQASLIFRQCAAFPRHRLSPRAFFIATRHLSWSKTGAKNTREGTIGGRRRRIRPGSTGSLSRETDVAAANVAQSTKEAQFRHPDEHVDLKFFEKDAKDGSEQEQVDVNATQEFDRDLEEEERTLDDRIREIEDDVKKSTFAEIPGDFAKELFSDDERQRIIENIDKNWAELSKPMHNVHAWEGLPETSYIYVDSFNGAVNEVSLNPSSDRARIELWRWYSRCKIFVKDFLVHVPEQAWELLWLSQSEDTVANPTRSAHLKQLADDMVKAGQSLSQEQKHSRIEGMFMNGQAEEALKEWETQLKAHDGATAEMLEQGIRMYAYNGNIRRALQLLNAYLAINSWNGDVFKTVLSVMLVKHDKSARSLYKRLAKKYQLDMTMEDYDGISLMFLKNSQRDMALEVFRDMMLAGDVAKEKDPSFIRQLQITVGDLIAGGKSAPKVNSLMLDSINYLPRKYQNKFFFAKWLRKLVSMGELDGAAQVVELMYERGISPDAMHVNGLVGAWLRLDEADSRTKAEDMAWAMIQTRLDRVAERRNKQIKGDGAQPRSVRDDAEGGAKIPTWISRKTPAANIETFCLLVKYYLENEDFATVRHLRNLIAYAEIPMNSVFMNHLMYAELQHRSYVAAWQRFDVMSRTTVADIETWLCLWEGQKQEMMKSANPSAEVHNPKMTQYPKPRRLFASMMEWSKGLQGKDRRDALEDMEIDTYNDIIRCFCLSRDLTGVFVAMRALTDQFQVYPEPNTVRMLLLQISKMQTWRNRPGRRLLKPGRQETDEKMSKTTEVLSLITEHRRQLLQQKGVDFEKNLDQRQQGEETLRTLMQFVFTISKRMSGVHDDFQKQFQVATKEMGVDAFDDDAAMALVV